ncbi:hypothetical protein F5144DRAFT_645099 [Chaetomium tenue]|uniref:Uncharacterized protein n=1 Tax=Chaetomium tenue TaxID=1854479 RepID=A0ACB7PBP4_9PEZI|nr:hypothetical protein F5144DRAFT_645099 [Chaetomium globosum]
MNDPDPTSVMKLVQLQELIVGESPSKSEGGIQTGFRILSSVKKAFALAKTVPEIAEWVKSCDKLQAQTSPRPSVVGVVGSTGAGKSSVINAVLNEECLVPTSCMRACTAVITEISYNYSEQEDQKYCAEIHFVAKEDWIRELRVMLADIIDGQDGLGTELTNSDSETAVAYHKMRAVYPFLKSEGLNKGTFDIEELVTHPSVKGLLGTVKQVASSTSKEFLGLLKRFIDSKEKAGGGEKKSDEMEYWPLIKVVKVFVRSPILESGLVLVDLPGVHDSNAARSAVAAKYIERCSGLWVVAPITRAVDDKVAQNLLGGAFKRQLQFDGNYSSISVICSKADDLSVTEILKLLPEEAEATQLHARTMLLETSRDELQETSDSLKRRLSELNSEIEQGQTDINNLRSALDYPGDEDDPILFSPGGSRKRPTREAASKATKRIRPEKEHITREKARQQLRESESRQAELLTERKELRRLGSSTQKDLKEVKTETRSLKSETKQACIRYRNNYSRPTIQAQFAEGIRELDHENAADDEDNFNPHDLRRDYSDIAKKLPVFCVSSKAYQKISGRLENDERVAGFSRLEDTEVPALQRHALGIVQEARAATGRRFLNELSHFLTSLHLQVVQSDQPLKLADNMREKELQSLAKAVGDLQTELVSAILQSFVNSRKVVDSYISRKFDFAAREASEAAIPTVNSWISHRTNGGLAYETFRATCVRDGAFKKRSLDFNAALADPMTKRFPRAWEYVFSVALPQNSDTLAEALGKSLRSFRLRMDKRPELKKAPSFDLVTRQAENLEIHLKDIMEIKDMVRTGQKQANRLFIPAIGSAMAGAYMHCVGQRGIGCFKRMKAHMVAHVNNVRGTMFKAATDNVESALKHTLEEAELEMIRKVGEVIGLVNNGYSSLLANRDIFRALSSSRDEIQDLLSQVDQQFEQVLRPTAHENTAIMDVDFEVSATTSDPGTSLMASGGGCEVPVAASTDRASSGAIAGNLQIKEEPL